MTLTEPSDVVEQAASLCMEVESRAESSSEAPNLETQVGPAEGLSSEQVSAQVGETQPSGVQATTSSATLLDQMDKEQDQVLLRLDQLNSDIESLIEEYTRTRRTELGETAASTADASEETPGQSLKAA